MYASITVVGTMTCYKFVTDNRKPILIEHSRICYPEAIDQTLVDSVDISFPGIVIKYDNGYYLIEDGVHRIAKYQRMGIYESLFYVVTIDEYKNGVVHMKLDSEEWVLGEWNHSTLDPVPHLDNK
jgi:hypothetical protein